jgi:exopolyphosphatase/guanosine-5'-triphosphate,3'-diphosphate pyrophosphatase
MKLGALDVGSNTVLMLVVDADGANRLTKLADFSRITRLGRGVDATGRLHPSSARATLDAIAEFVAQARALGAEKILTAATAALRDAVDGADFVAQVKTRSGIDLDIISGAIEAQLSWLSAVNGLQLDPAAKLLIVDIGGGSTELIRAQPGGGIEAVSLQIGSVRLTERIVHSDPPTAREAADLRVGIDEVLATVHWNYLPDVMVGIAGTVTTIGAMALGLDNYDSAQVHGSPISHEVVLQTLGRLGSVNLEERKKIPCIEAGRADVIFAGAAILERVMAHFQVKEVIVSDQGIRWGLVWRELKGNHTNDESGIG